MLSGSKPRGESGVLLVPVLPGAAIRSVPLAEEREPTAQRVLPVALALAGVLAFVAAAIVLFDRAFSKTQRASAPPASVTAPTHAVVPHPAPAPRRAQQRPQQRARSTALHLAAGLPVELESTALLRVGSKLYAVGGTTRAGSPSDGIWRLDLRTGRVTSAGSFVEPLSGSGSAVRDGVLYLAGGWTGEKAATAVLRWTPEKSSSLVARLPVGLRAAAAVFVGGRLFVAGGSPRRVFEVDVDTGTVSVRATAPGALRRTRTNLDYLIESSRAAG